ncbi:MAG: RNA polymerase sigma-70 factor [Bacteroidales bacterium]|nr:RNA polymerase sigma-70 factor [Bacteroidales bacterium]
MSDYLDDLRLAGLVQSKDSANAYSILYLRFYSALASYATMFVGPSEADDIVQNVMLDFWNKRKFIHVRDSLASYLFQSTRNRCLNLIKRDGLNNRMLSDLKLALIDESIDFNRHDTFELKALISKALEDLPDEVRRTFEMSRFEGKTYAAIASETGVSVKTVEYRISKALRKLETELADYLPVFPLFFAFIFSRYQ